MTNFRTSSPALGVVSSSGRGMLAIDLPILPAEYLVGHPGTSPSLTVPATFGRLADVAAAWTYLAEAAEFFAVSMPTLDELRDACGRFLVHAEALPLVAVHITIVDFDDSARALVTGEAALTRWEPVRIEDSDDTSPLARPGDPQWRRMAARTTSRAVEDSLRVALDGRGCADRVGADAVPFLGALVFEDGADAYGLDDPEPTSVLDQLQECGAITGVRRVDRLPAGAERAWWISPWFEMRPVSAVGMTAYRVDAAIPMFARCA